MPGTEVYRWCGFASWSDEKNKLTFALSLKSSGHSCFGAELIEHSWCASPWVLCAHPWLMSWKEKTKAADPCLGYLSYHQHTSIESNIALGRHFPKNYIALAIALSMSHFLSDTVGDLKLQTTRSRCSSRRPMDLLFSFGIVEHNTWLIMVKWLECFA